MPPTPSSGTRKAAGQGRAGVVPVSIGILQPRDTVAWIIDDSHVKLVFCDGALKKNLPQGVAYVDVDSDDDDGLSAFKRPGTFTPLAMTETVRSTVETSA